MVQQIVQIEQTADQEMKCIDKAKSSKSIPEFDEVNIKQNT